MLLVASSSHEGESQVRSRRIVTVLHSSNVIPWTSELRNCCSKPIQISVSGSILIGIPIRT